MAQNLIHFIQLIYGFRIKHIVIDFIKDSKGNYWMTDVKNFTFDEYEKVRYLKLHAFQSPDERKQSQSETRSKTAATHKCTLCQLPYEKQHVQNVITKRMLYKLN